MQKRRTTEKFIKDLKETRKVSEIEENFETVWNVFSILAIIAVIGLETFKLLNPVICFSVIIAIIILNYLIDNKYSFDLYKRL